VANPTTQGVSLRGAGASGSSRTLVLSDGLPLNDPFGGWVYWDRIPRASIDHIEVVRGGSSDLYGSDALSGVINVISRSTVSNGIHP
jgi:outer membrane cobalamin receptor